MKRNNQKKIEKLCSGCSKKYYVHKCREMSSRYCSVDCYNKNRGSIKGRNHGNWNGGKTTVVCEVCGKNFFVYGKRINTAKYCSRRCQGKAYSIRYLGPNGPSWRGGRTPNNTKIRNSKKYLQWRAAVFARDEWTCQECKQVGGKLHAHHVFSFAEFPEHRFLLWNGITLCEGCHSKVHGRTINSFGNVGS